jgi:hypothetical protein
MAMIGPENIILAAVANAVVGVNPPTAIPQFNSIRSTPRWAASATSSIPPTQSSTVIFRSERVDEVIRFHAKMSGESSRRNCAGYI